MEKEDGKQQLKKRSTTYLMEASKAIIPKAGNLSGNYKLLHSS